MAIISEWNKHLKLRNKLALLYISSFTAILGITFYFIYFLSEYYRQEEFYQRLIDRTASTYNILITVDEIDEGLLRLFDKNTIHKLGGENILIFDDSCKLLYSNSDTVNTSFADGMLIGLMHNDEKLKITGDKYDIVGLSFYHNGHRYYGIARAIDNFGKRKIHFLAILLICTFVIVTILLSVLSVFLSAIITKPISRLTGELEKISPIDLSNRVSTSYAQDEIGFLAGKFNELLDKLENAFKFQSHYIHHLSHELKTPLAIMMANCERAEAEGDQGHLIASMQFQKLAIMDLSHIINAMLDIAKAQHSPGINTDSIRVDELVFECADEITYLNSEVRFDFSISDDLDEAKLTLWGNSRMIKMAIMNLLKNAVNFSSNKKAGIQINASGEYMYISVQNDGPVLDAEDSRKLFKHLFRGKNSQSVKGFGLGLVLAHRIVALHNGHLDYDITATGKNRFTLTLPLANTPGEQ